MADDYYQVLGVARDATQEEIKKAYRKMAHKHHPDKGGGDEEAFKRVNEAYQVLGNEQKRSQYDQFGQTFDGGAGPDPFGGFGGQGVHFDFGNIGDIFGEFFGGGRGSARTRVRRGSDVQVDVEISFLEAVRGVKKSTEHRLHQRCDHCEGSGAEPGTKIETCGTCGGQGAVTQTSNTPFGSFAQRAVCPDCRGEGKRATTACSQCRGEGRVVQDRKLTVDIPAGIADGQIIRLSGKGEYPVRGGVAGDLYANIHVKPDKELQRDGNDIRSRAAVSFADAALGTDVTVRTVEGDETLHVPPGTQPNAEFRLDRKGFPRLNGQGRGDHIVTVEVAIPQRLSKEQRSLLESFRRAPKKKGLFF